MSMQLKYSLDENDFLQYQLYAASKSKNIKAQRSRTVIMMIATFALLSYMVYSPGDSLSYLIVTFFGLLLILYKWYEKKRYSDHYRKNIAENYKERFGLISSVTFGKNQIIEENKLGESKINYESLTEINEIEDYYFLKLLTGQSLIIPKKVIADKRDFDFTLEEIKNRFHLKNNVDLAWKWK